MGHNSSKDERAMRDAGVAWGRARWPEARVYHELVVGRCRADLAFICPDDLILMEIKSAKDKLDRLETQVKEFRGAAPEMWVFIDIKWLNHDELPYIPNCLVYDEGKVSSTDAWKRRTSRNRLCYNEMLGLLWAQEARNIAGRNGCLTSKKMTQPEACAALALHLTGKEILHEVCRELRARVAFNVADPPIYQDSKKPAAVSSDRLNRTPTLV